MIAVVVIFSFLSAPSNQEIEAQLRADSIAAAQQKEKEILTQRDSLRLADAERIGFAAGLDSTSLFFHALTGEEKEVTLRNNKMAVTIASRGAHVNRIVLAEYKDQEKQPLRLMDKGDGMLNLELRSKEGILSTAAYYFEPVEQTDSSVVMRLQAGENSYLDFIYRLHDDEYMVDFAVQATGMTGILNPAADQATLLWKQKLRQLERGHSYENRYSNLSYKTANDYDYLSDSKTDQLEVKESLRWVAFKNQFFSTVLLADKAGFAVPALSSQMQDEGSGYLKSLSAEVKTSFDPTGAKPTQLTFYFGPNHYKMLRAYDRDRASTEKLELEQLVYLGWPVLRWINQYFTINLFDWLSRLNLGMGVVLLLMTLIVKGLVYPLTYKSYISSARMRVLKPQIDELGKKYPRKEDAMKKQQEMMSIYSKYGVSPMGGCLPMLLQMPIWMALFMFVPTAIELRQQSFLWADDLSTYDDLISWGFNVPLLGSHLSLFCLLMTVANLVFTKYNMDQQKGTMTDQSQMKMMKWMMYLMPVFFIFVLNNYASGLNYYYFLSSLTSILIMIILRRVVKDDKILAKLNEYATTAKPEKKGGIMARLGEMQRKQEELQRKQAEIRQQRKK